jgi:glycosyltransferase involved in cell wall biosynthesis
MSEPMVSIIVCVYNGSEFLASTLDSALAQTCSEFELIVIDDGSTDGSMELLGKYADPRIRTIGQPNRGAAAALQAGIDLARGNYVALLDQDDIWERDKLQCHIELFQQKPDIDLTFSWFRLIDGQGNDMGLHSSRYRGTISFPDLLCDFVIGASSNVVIRRSALSTAHVDASLPRVYDWDLFLRIALLAPDNVQAIPKDLMRYRRRDGQISSDVESLKQEWRRALAKLRDLVPDQVAPVEKLARSNMNRYFARLAYSRSAYASGLLHLGEGFRDAPAPFLADSRNWLTAAACLTGLVLPERLHRTLERLAGLRRELPL